MRSRRIYALAALHAKLLEVRFFGCDSLRAALRAVARMHSPAGLVAPLAQNDILGTWSGFAQNDSGGYAAKTCYFCFCCSIQYRYSS